MLPLECRGFEFQDKNRRRMFPCKIQMLPLRLLDLYLNIFFEKRIKSVVNFLVSCLNVFF